MTMTSMRRVMLAAGAATVLAVAACGQGDEDADEGQDPGAPQEQAGDDTGDTSDPADGDEEPAADGPADVPAELEFDIETLAGGSFDGAQLVGAPAVLWFWAPWCSMCASEAPDVSALAQEYDGAATVLGVAGLDDDPDAMRTFVDTHGVDNVEHLLDLDGQVWRGFEVTAQSTFVVLDARGEVVERGIQHHRDLPGHLDALIG